MTRLDRQMAFLTQACALKTVDRQNVLQDLSRPENAAEHSWHVALYALVCSLPDLDSAAARDRAIAMILLHDLVEIDAGDHPIHLDHDPAHIAMVEARAAERLFGMLPPDQGATLHALWREFEAAQTPVAKAAKLLDHVQPIVQASAPDAPRADQVAVVRDNLATGRARHLPRDWPQMDAHVRTFLDGTPAPRDDTAAHLAFLNQADALKSVTRATLIAGGSRRENSAEHSWHLALYALVLGEYADPRVNIARVIRMLLIHDLVEIDAGDVPIFGTHDVADIQARELAAAHRLFGLLPASQEQELLALWLEFEANESPDARFAKSLDRFQPPNQNLASQGGSWVEFGVDYQTVATKVGAKVAQGAPVLWDWIAPRIQAFFADRV